MKDSYSERDRKSNVLAMSWGYINLKRGTNLVRSTEVAVMAEPNGIFAS